MRWEGSGCPGGLPGGPTPWACNRGLQQGVELIDPVGPSFRPMCWPDGGGAGRRLAETAASGLRCETY